MSDRILLVSGFGEDGGGIFAVRNGIVEPVDRLETTGLAVSPCGRYLVRALAGHHTPDAEGHVLLYDEQGVQWYRRAAEICDPHGVVFLDADRFAIASTGINAVHCMDLAGSTTAHHQFGEAFDAWHLNCPTTTLDGRLVSTAFGLGAEPVSWRAGLVARQPTGVVVDVATGAPLFGGLVGPHDPLALRNGGWLVNNSALREVLWLDAQGVPLRRTNLGGWTRGLHVDEDQDVAWVGVSVRRYEDPDGRAQLVELELSSGEERRRTALPCEEIFSIVEVDEILLTGVRVGLDALPGLRGDGPPPLACDVPLSPNDLQIDLAAGSVPSVLAPESWVRVPLTVTNLGSTPFSSRGASPIRFGCRWFDATGALLELQGRGTLPHVLAPGGTLTGSMTFSTPAQPGQYTLELTLIQEMHLWFADVPGGVQSVRLPIEVSPA